MTRGLLLDGFRLMRERLWLYAVLATLAAAAAWHALPGVDIYGALVAAKDGHPLELIAQPPVSVVLGLSIVAVFFVVPSALRRIQPSFRMTALRLGIAIGTLLLVGIVVDAGYVLAVMPGIVAAVLLSQTLVGALLQSPETARPGQTVRTVVDAFRGSYDLTRGHFATTLAVVIASLALFVVPATCALMGLWILGAKEPRTLVVTAPLVLLLLVYSECVRYTLIVRWYRCLGDRRAAVAMP